MASDLQQSTLDDEKVVELAHPQPIKLHALSSTVTQATTEDEKVIEISNHLVNGKHVLLHGPGGSGKTCLGKKVISNLRTQGKNVGITIYGKQQANMFGMGAMNIHYFFGFVPHKSNNGENDVKLDTATQKYLTYMRPDANGDKSYRRMLRMLKEKKFGDSTFITMITDILDRIINTDVLVVDEVSAVGVKIFQLMDRCARKYREVDDKPFGGMSVLLIGDMLQTAPVKDLYPFQCRLWDELALSIYIFKEIYRFKDKEWAKLLLRMRRGANTPADISIIRDMVGKEPVMKSDTLRMKVCVTRKEVTEHNNAEVRKLFGEGYRIASSDRVYRVAGDTRTQINDDEQVKSYINQYNEDLNLEKELLLKVGARIMIIKNDSKTNIANGQVGTILGFVMETVKDRKMISKITVLLDKTSGPIDIEKTTVNMLFNRSTLEIERKQFPLRAAYAATTQKIQGETQDYTELDYGKSWAGPGTAYVGFSRAREQCNIRLVGFNSSCITTSKIAMMFTSDIEDWKSEADAVDEQFEIHDEEEGYTEIDEDAQDEVYD